MREGWKCPGCGRCWAPFVASCAECEKVAAKPIEYISVYPSTRPGEGVVVNPNISLSSGQTPDWAIAQNGAS